MFVTEAAFGPGSIAKSGTGARLGSRVTGSVDSEATTSWSEPDRCECRQSSGSTHQREEHDQRRTLTLVLGDKCRVSDLFHDRTPLAAASYLNSAAYTVCSRTGANFNEIMNRDRIVRTYMSLAGLYTLAASACSSSTPV